MLVEEFSLRPGSGGKGVENGGDGTRRKIRFLEDMTLALLSGHRVIPPPGLDGGEPGAKGVNRVIRKDGSQEVLASADKTEMKAGDVYWLDTPSGVGVGKMN